MEKQVEKEILIRLIDSRVKMIIADANTFIWLRHEYPEKLSENKNIGGGNLLMVLGLFSALNFMAKIYAILRKGGSCVVNRDDIENFKAIIKTHPELKNLVQPKVVGQIRDEESAFVRLINDSGSHFGLSDDLLRCVWKSYRNHLTHSATIYPGDSSVTFMISNKNFSEFTEHLKKRIRPVFAKNQKGSRCYPDILNAETKFINEWLIKEIKNNKFSDENISATFDWIQGWI